MKKKLLTTLWIFALLWWAQNTLAQSENNEIIDKLENKTTKAQQKSFELKTFQSCRDMESVLWDYMKDYMKNSRWYFNGWGVMIEEEMMMEDSADSWVLEWVSSKVANTPTSADESADFSETNTQVAWVDEADIVKTDGATTYYYNQKQKAVYILSKQKVLKKINLPKTFNGAELYIWNNKLTVIATAYNRWEYRNYFISRNTRTYTSVFDVSNPEQPVLEKLHSSDGNYSKSRKIGEYVYILTNNYINYPYYNTKDTPIISAKNLLPKQTDITRVENSMTANVKNLPYIAKTSSVADCNEIEYIMPDEDTIEKYSFSPNYNIISVINTQNTKAKVQTKVIAGNNSEIYMSTENLYMTSAQYFSSPVVCPFNARCSSPFYESWESTLLHKLNINWMKLNYQTSNVVPGQPLTQYSMDEKDENFRIITQKFYPERETWVYVLDNDLEMIWKLEWLWKTEDFKSSRFIWDKLYLVTFEQVDPFFAIDMSSATPKVLGELKIPGYSSYLHPYDETHIIGLGQSTEETEWGWVRNDWLKVDLYKVNYDKKCGDAGLTDDQNAKCESWDYKWIIVEQKYTMTLWERGSYSEVLYNPRAFIWNKNKNLLLLPVNLYKNDDPANEYRNTDFFQWISVIEIDKERGINEKWRVSHIDTSWIEEERTKACSRYANVPKEPVCKKIIGWGEYCGEWVQQYVPPYCFEDSKIEEYIAQQSYKFQDEFVKRALYVWDDIYTFSDAELQFHDINTLQKESAIEMK